jgi:hypothetical protein
MTAINRWRIASEWKTRLAKRPGSKHGLVCLAYIKSML